MSNETKIIKAPGQAIQSTRAGELTGDVVMDDLLRQSMNQLEADRREADDLYEMIRNNAEQMPDDSNMSQTAVQALKVKQNVTAQATRILDITARYKLQREKMLQQSKGGNIDDELIELIGEGNQDPPMPEDKKEL